MATMKNAAIQHWVDEVAKLCTPDNVVFCDGSTDERDRLTKECLESGELIDLLCVQLAQLSDVEVYLDPLGEDHQLAALSAEERAIEVV